MGWLGDTWNKTFGNEGLGGFFDKNKAELGLTACFAAGGGPSCAALYAGYKGKIASKKAAKLLQQQAKAGYLGSSAPPPPGAMPTTWLLIGGGALVLVVAVALSSRPRGSK